MERIEKSKLAKMFLLLSLLFLLLLTPFISTFFRSSYVYFLFNLLIIVLCVEAGLLSSISKSHDEKKPVVTKETIVANRNDCYEDHMSVKKAVVIKEEPKMEVVERVQKLRRCPSRPSIFFIGSCEADLIDKDHQQVMVVEEKMRELTKQELFMKAEMFIGNFYNQLKMQREASWKKIHGLYHRDF